MKIKELNKLKAKRDELISKIPLFHKMLRATISTNYLTCGYKKCRCHRGEKHGPFMYLSAKEKKKLKMYFVPKELANKVKEGVQNYNKIWKLIYELCRINRKILYIQRDWK